MGFRFWRRVKIAPGLTLNLSKSGASFSFGGRGAKVSLGPRGTHATVGLPGTGLFYTTKLSPKRSRWSSARSRPAAAPEPSPEERLTLGFFRRLITPAEEQALVDGCREFVRGDETAALKHFKRATHLADGAFLAGFLALKHERLKEAVKYLNAAADDYRRLGRYVKKYGMSVQLSLPITEEVAAVVGLTLRGVLLGLVEAYQRQRRWKEAAECLARLQRLEPDDVAVKLSLAELLLDALPGDKQACRKVVRLAEGVRNESGVHAALMLYKAKALRQLGLLDAARDTLTQALKRKKDRDEELLHALRYERALVYEALGQKRRARSEWEKLYADAPGYEDVARRLGL